MSSITQTTPTRNQLTSQYDFGKIFLFDNKYRSVNIANASGDTLELTAGTLIGAVGSTYQVYKSGTSNIQLIGVIAENIDIPDGSNADVNICIGGHVDENLLVFDGTDTLATAVSNKTIRDRLASDTLGIKLESTNELTKADN